ncbi:daunorubicin ABC transporter ATPase [Haloarcula hispanica N601]|uniref:Daunorubicin ABC transporter ATPase n=2 Tax=Haloarcula hispanica TaxID=51589 RepID=V5TPK6_HALHI|nr:MULTISPECIES: ABC transporter ATP-binding protein [Haloarcula]AEM58153.1 ABC transporter ATP-binding protein [Haloarcula hispanica ATCC 33960]AHB66892.1 daunorubicin ABC transporter ATPase [Haloarcula hispanica N601]AJF25189.1 daunorubicin ABC transporter ATPase [Haloarcula sp. CBA1115]KZX47326.1 multidrug ABC transporter ATP-binding protein [Haloarcula sp. K1]NHX40360.1 ABC transporter ATP-binding protein [Haloarcula sp. R1-2]
MCPPAPAIVTEGLTKRYSGVSAIADLDLTVPRGSVFGFLGPNGAGKTSTIRILTTLTNPTSGTARVAGESVADRAAVVEHIGFLPEEPPLYDELTGREQLEYVAGLRGHEDWGRVESLLDRFDLDEDADRRVETYSKGMKQKLGLVQALLHEPEVLFLDEPTSGLDPRAARTVRDTISEVAAADTTVFLSTHILPVVEELADTVGVLYDGDLVAEGSPDELTDSVESGSTLEDVFLDVTSEHPGER